MHDGGTVVVIEGPRFSTRAESAWFRAMGWDLVNMTAYPEGWLARELGLCYANLSLVTDYDVGVAGDGARGGDGAGRAGGVRGEHRAAPRAARAARSRASAKPRPATPAGRRSTMPRCSRNRPCSMGQATFERLLPTAAFWLLPY